MVGRHIGAWEGRRGNTRQSAMGKNPLKLDFILILRSHCKECWWKESLASKYLCLTAVGSRGLWQGCWSPSYAGYNAFLAWNWHCSIGKWRQSLFNQVALGPQKRLNERWHVLLPSLVLFVQREKLCKSLKVPGQGPALATWLWRGLPLKLLSTMAREQSGGGYGPGLKDAKCE